MRPIKLPSGDYVVACREPGARFPDDGQLCRVPVGSESYETIHAWMTRKRMAPAEVDAAQLAEYEALPLLPGCEQMAAAA